VTPTSHISGKGKKLLKKIPCRTPGDEESLIFNAQGGKNLSGPIYFLQKTTSLKTRRRGTLRRRRDFERTTQKPTGTAWGQGVSLEKKINMPRETYKTYQSKYLRKTGSCGTPSRIEGKQQAASEGEQARARKEPPGEKDKRRFCNKRYVSTTAEGSSRRSLKMLSLEEPRRDVGSVLREGANFPGLRHLGKVK